MVAMVDAVALNTDVVAPTGIVTDPGTVSKGLLLVNVTVPAGLKETVLLAYDARAVFVFHSGVYDPAEAAIRCDQPLPNTSESMVKALP